MNALFRVWFTLVFWLTVYTLTPVMPRMFEILKDPNALSYNGTAFLVIGIVLLSATVWAGVVALCGCVVLHIYMRTKPKLERERVTAWLVMNYVAFMAYTPLGILECIKRGIRKILGTEE